METVCCMCGDVGFSDKLFRCSKCRHRFQHLYCSNYYSELSEPIQVCDWCQSEGKSSKHGGSSSRKSMQVNNDSRSTGNKNKQQDHEEGSEKAAKNPSSTSSPRPTTRKYKLLKDVIC
ncbi:unnamed protein product [Fraxinus pennsylvanica]|uniref:PHD-type zinc finger plants domain-containing protein n=1 Tax=Fraxinus pennsylvanica TaxID=56036 RepID=A0AAD2EE70_9LAMI|nr:unnamed protein product [Fraxinus pennsylvanica]